LLWQGEVKDEKHAMEVIEEHRLWWQSVQKEANHPAEHSSGQ